MAGPIRIAILGNASSALGSIRATETATGRLGSKFRSVAAAAAKFAAAGAALGAGLAAYAAVNFAQAAANDAQQAAVLAQTLSQAAGASRKQIAANEEWISSMGRSLGIADDDLRPALGKLAIATGSVAKAQRLAAIAADVAAGRHKDLATVTEALSKAQSGNLSGLTRLGVNIKDAAGHTKTLDQVTADLAKTYKGAASTAANTAAGKFDRMKLALSETAEDLGRKLLPLVNALGNYLLSKGIPAVEKLAASAAQKLGPVIQDLTGWFRDNRDNLQDLGREFLNTAIPAIKTAGQVVGDLVGFFAGLPSPIRNVGIEIAIAALAFPKISGALTAVKAPLANFVTGVKTAETRTAALASAARTAAGIGGMVLLADGATRSNKALGALETTLGGAATGFALGGPIGALIGGAGGGLIGLKRSFDNAGDSVRAMQQNADDLRGAQLNLRDALDQTTGAMTKQARQTVAQDLYAQGLTGSIKTLGLNTRDVVSAILGQEKALKRVNEATQKYATVGGARATDRQNALSDASVNVAAYLGGAIPKFKEAGREIRAVAEGTESWREALKGLPKELRTEVKTPGLDTSAEGIDRLKRKFDLQPKQVKTLVEATHADLSAQQVQSLIDKINNLHDRTVTIRVDTIRTPGGKDVPLPGAGGTRDVPAGSVERIAGKRQAQDFLAGLVDGFQGLSGITAGIDRVTKYIDQQFKEKFAKIRADLNKTLDGKALDKALEKAQKRLDAQQAKILKGLRDQEQAIKAVGRAQDANNAALDQARSALEAIKTTAADYAASIKDSVVEFGNLTQLGGGAGFGSAQQLIDLLKAKVDQAQQFANMIDALRQSGLSETSIQQLINAGVEGGIGTAQAILAGGPAAIAQINSLQAQLTAAGTQLGGNAAQAMYGAGIQAAQGLVDGLAANADALAEQATKLAKALVRAVKKALGINSPSRVFRDLGRFTVQGLTLGLDENYVRRQGETLGRALERGFGSPALDAFLAAKADANRQSVAVTLTAQQLDALTRGRQIQADLDVYYSEGGRRGA